MLDNENNVVESVEMPMKVKIFSWKKLILYIVTFYWLILLIKWLFKVTIKLLDKLREYIHNLTNKEKMIEVIFYTLVGIVLGVLLNRQIIQGVNYIIDFWNNIALPWVKELFSII